MAVSIYILTITLKVTGLNAPTKDIDWLNGHKNKTHIYAVTHFKYGDTELKVRG